MTSRGAGLSRPGPIWGAYPQRDANRARSGGSIGGRWRPLNVYQQVAAEADRLAQRWHTLARDQWPSARLRLVGTLRRRGLDRTAVAQALGCVAAHARETLGIRYYPSQYVCAAAMLDQRLAEMATGEGKTLAAALAAAVAALAGVPVHVITANDYLAARDADHLGGLYRALGLTVGAVSEDPAAASATSAPSTSPYGADIVYTTARTVAFDYLRDRLSCPELDSDLALRAGKPTGLRLRGLCMAIVDEADSILIDEAQMPLILSESRRDPSEHARLWQALDWARRLQAGEDYQIDGQHRRAILTPAGQQRILSGAGEYGGFGLNHQHRQELLEQALSALYALSRDVDYVVEDGEVVIVDTITGRAAVGRVWSRGLHGAVAMKEGLVPPDATVTRARTTFRRFFARYHHLCGLSGTLREVSAELRRDYGVACVAVPLHRPSQRKQLPARVFADRLSLFEQALERARELVNSQQRPVLLTTDSVADTCWFEQRLKAGTEPFAVLNALTSEQEASIVAQAALTARITVATQMAGRGTDIMLSESTRAAGGLHVLNLQHNRSGRVDRQIAGRAARQGHPGSCEHWRALNAPLTAQSRLCRWLRKMPDRHVRSIQRVLPISGWAVHWAQKRAEIDDELSRKAFAKQDRQWASNLQFSLEQE